MPSVSVVLPCRNEERNLPYVLGAIPELVTEVILVDGGSTDRTVEITLDHYPKAQIIHQHSPGKGAASFAGLLQATSDIAILIDGDDSMNCADIERMYEVLVTGSDVVHASRELSGGGSSDFSKVRRFGNSSMTWATNRLYNERWTDLTYGYMGMWRDVVDGLELKRFLETPGRPLRDAVTGSRHRPAEYGHGFEVEVLIMCRAARAGLKISEIPSYESKRRHGTSSLHAVKDGLRVAGAVVKERVSPRTLTGLATVLDARMENRLVSLSEDSSDVDEINDLTLD